MSNTTVDEFFNSQDGLRTTVQKRLFNDVFKPMNTKWNRYAVLVIDDDSLKIISSVIGMYNLMEHRITLVESLEKRRAPFADMAVIYIISPSSPNSLDLVIQDWSSDQQKYADAVFLYFTSRIPDETIAKIKSCKPLLRRLKALQEINIEFLAKQERAFHFDMNHSDTIRHLYVDRSNSNIMQVMAKKLVTLCATLHEYPHIRYPVDSPLCETLAKGLQGAMNEFVSASPNWWYHGDTSHTSRDRSTLLILDRSHDPLAPLMHEFTYQAMVQDLLKINDDKISYMAEVLAEDGVTETKSKKEVLLNDNDELWVELRSRHIADVIQNLSGRIREIVNSKSGAVFANNKNSQQQGKNLTLSQMSAALRSLPEYREIMSKLSQHMHLAHQCMDVFSKEGLLDISDVEQTLATGQNDDGERPKLSALLDQVENALPKVSSSTKLRLLGILMLSQKKNLSTQQMKAGIDRIYELSGLSEVQIKTIENLLKLQEYAGGHAGGSGEVSRTERLGNMIRGPRLTSTARSESDSEYSSSRYVCNLKSMLQEMTAERLDKDAYPGVVPLPQGRQGTAVASIRTRRTRSRVKKNQKTKKMFVGGRQMVFVMGGLCYSELRVAEELMERGDREIILGSTSFFSPTDFLKALEKSRS